jgi:O-antigen/teichoic acid export membrane protein
MIKLVKRSVFFKNTILYIFTSLITAGFSFLLLTILSNYLSDADFGIIENFTALSNLFIHILCWGNEANIVHYYSEKTKKEEYYQVFNCILIQSIIVLFVVVLFNLNILYISRTVLICSVIYAILNSFYTVVMASLQLEKKVTKFSIATISCSVLNFGLSIVFVLKTGNYWGRIGGLFISMFLVFLIVLFSSIKSKLENFL